MSLERFLKFQAQTSTHPFVVEVDRAEGSFIYDKHGKPYLDFIAGVSACPLGHNNPKVVSAIKEQLDKYLHVMVYGEFVQDAPVALAELMAEHMPQPLQTTYFTNSGTEAIEGAIKLSKRYTGRAEIISAINAYHGNTMGSMSVMGYENRKRAFRPLIPGINFIEFNNEKDIEKITKSTASVILETIQGGAGFVEPKNNYLLKVKKRCEEVGALLILDEIQPGIGRTGKLFGFQNYGVVPDIVVTGKGLGGGMPIGAFTSSKKMMDCLMDNPKLGHITTFGGHPVIAAAALATLKEITSSDLIPRTLEKEKFVRNYLKHPLIHEIRGKGLMLAAMLPNSELASEVILECKNRGLLLFWLLFEGKALRITPPLTISIKELKKGCDIIIDVLNNLKQ